MSVFEDRIRKRTIEHVTLPEGASRAAARSQIDTDTLERIREDVLPALATGVAVAVPGNPDYLLRPVAASEGALAVRLESVAGAELMTIGIGWSDPGASEVWQSMAVATEAEVRTEVANLDKRLSTQIANLETRLIRWMVGTVIATATLTVGILRFIG